MQTRNYVYINGHQVLHATVCRDYVCGVCGSRIVSRWFADKPHWRSVCSLDPTHGTESFVTRSSLARREAQSALNQDRANEVFNHLPAALKAAIHEEETCPSKD